MKDRIKELVEEENLLDPQNDVLWEINWQKRLDLLTVNLSETIEYLDECNGNELLSATELLEELMIHFKSQDLISCAERMLQRCKDKNTVEYLKDEIERMKSILF